MPESADLLPLCAGTVDAVHPYAYCLYRNSGINDAKAYFDPPLASTMIHDERWELSHL